jgi:hypothetical protein
MSVEQILQKEIEESSTWLDRENEESTYKRDLQKRIELINWFLENMKNPNIYICAIIENRMNEIILKLNHFTSNSIISISSSFPLYLLRGSFNG